LNLSWILKPTKRKRAVFFILSDSFIFTFSLFLSSYILNEKVSYIWFILIPLKIFILFFNGLYKIPWRYFGFRDLVKSFYTFSLLFLLTLIFTLNIKVAIVDYFVSFSLFLFLRGLKRYYIEIIKQKKYGKNTLIVGAGNTGEYIVRELLRGSSEYEPVAFVDDDVNKIGTKIHGIEVKGTLKDITRIVNELEIEAVIIAIPSLNHKKIRKIFEDLRNSGIKEIKIVPRVKNLPEKPTLVKHLEDLSIQDLLYREEVKIDYKKVENFLKNKKILVTGAGGSIGSEIVRQLLEFRPKEIIAIELDETELHNLTLEINELMKSKNLLDLKFNPIVADVRDFKKLEKIFCDFKPDIVFHAAAYKHVPLMEYFPEEAIKTNIFGTYNVVKAACKVDVEKFINISTDKAVNPTSVMGATKRFAEIICKTFNDICKTKFISVRFGNVLGSRGSVIPTFLEQLKKGGPLTVTHPDMKRYFMTIKEAVLLVFQAATIGKGGEVFVLDMGEPVKIVKLAEDLIKLHGLEPYKDIDIIFTGIRPGEKLFEELLTAEEGTDKTQYDKIFIAREVKNLYSKEELEEILKEIKKLICENSKPEEIKKYLAKYVPYYKPYI